ncbi:MAG: AMP-binding protein [Clostridiales bacterium]|nr:AMP-binding protein [Clostridiales bacterium]
MENRIGARLKILREEAGYSQVKLAKLAGIGQPSIGRYEGGGTAPSLAILLWYADFFGVSLDYIFGRTDDPGGVKKQAGGAADTQAPAVVRDVLTAAAESHPDLDAFWVRPERSASFRAVTYREAFADIRALGAALLELGLYGKHIAIVGDNCYSWILACYATLFGAGVVVPLDRELRTDELLYLLRHAKCEAVFYTERMDEMVEKADFVPFRIRMNRYTGTETPHAKGRTEGKDPNRFFAELRRASKKPIALASLLAAGRALPKEKIAAYQALPIDPDAFAALLFTSGSSENARGVMLSNRGMAANLSDMRAAHDVRPGGRTISILSMHHCFEFVMGQQFMFANGVCIAFGDGLKYIEKNMREVKPTVMLFVPLLLENLYQKILRGTAEAGKEADLWRRINDYLKLRGRLGPNDDRTAREKAREFFYEEQKIFGGKLDSIFTGAAPIDPQALRGLQEIGIKVVFGYGMTECGPLMTTTPYLSDTLAKIGSVGPRVASGRLRIDKPDAKGVGEICYQGPTVMIGYYEDEKRTERVMEDGWFHSGDYGLLDEDGWLYLTGREANIIVTKTGKNVFPEELEAELMREPYITEIMIFASEDKKRGGPLISAQIRPDYAVIREALGENFADDEGLVSDLIRGVIVDFNESLANYKRIRHVQIRHEEFEKTPTKKVVRRRNI